MWVYALIALMLLTAIAVQVYYAQANRAQATPVLKVVAGLNIGLLSALLVGVLWLGYTRAVR